MVWINVNGSICSLPKITMFYRIKLEHNSDYTLFFFWFLDREDSATEVLYDDWCNQSYVSNYDKQRSSWKELGQKQDIEEWFVCVDCTPHKILKVDDQSMDEHFVENADHYRINPAWLYSKFKLYVPDIAKQKKYQNINFWPNSQGRSPPWYSIVSPLIETIFRPAKGQKKMYEIYKRFTYELAIYWAVVKYIQMILNTKMIHAQALFE